LGGGIHSLHWAQSSCLIAAYYAVALPRLLFGEGIDLTNALISLEMLSKYAYTSVWE